MEVFTTLNKIGVAVKPVHLTFDPNVAPYQRQLLPDSAGPPLITILGFVGKAFPFAALGSRAESYLAKPNQGTSEKPALSFFLNMTIQQFLLWAF